MSDIKFTGRETASLLVAVLAVAALTPTASGEWGSVSGRFVIDGDAPAPAKIAVTRDQEFCGKHELVDESVVVGENGGLANAFFYLYLRRGKSVEVHPDYEESASAEIVLDNVGCRFEPHALLLRTGQTLVIKNSDPGLGHNTNATLVANRADGFNEIVPNDKPLRKQFKKSEAYPMPFKCNIHPWMEAFVLIKDNPYMAISAADGTFAINQLPAGQHEFVVFCGRTLANVKVGDKKTSRRGRVKLTIPAGGALDLGDISVPLQALK